MGYTTPRISPSQDDDQIMDLDDERAADVVFGARIDLETGHSLAAGSPRFLSSRNTPHFTPAEYDHEISATTTAERGDGHNVSPQPASYIGHSSSHPTPPRDDDQIMDLEDAETGDIVIWTKEYLDGGCDDRDEPVSFANFPTHITSRPPRMRTSPQTSAWTLYPRVNNIEDPAEVLGKENERRLGQV